MASSDQIKMLWEKRWVGRPVDTHFSAGGSSLLARSDETNQLVTHGKLGPPVEDTRRPSGVVHKVAIEVAVRAGILGAVEIARYLKTRRDAIKSQRNRSSEVSEADSRAATAQLATPDSAVTADFASEVDAVLEEHRTSMSNAEAERRIVAILMAAAFIADQVRALSNVRVQDASPELQSAMGKLTVPQLTDSMKRMLETNAVLLDDEASADFMKVFGGGRSVDGQYVPLRNDKIKDELRLSDGEI